MTSRVLSIALLLLIATAFTNQVKANDVTMALLKARKEITDNRLAEAQKTLEKALAEGKLTSKEVASLELVLGRVLADNGQITDGLKMMRRHYREKTALQVTTMDYAHTLYKAKKLKEAAQLIRAHLLKDLNWRTEAHLLLGKILTRMDERREGAKHLVTALVLGNEAIKRNARNVLYHTVYTNEELASYGYKLKIKEMPKRAIEKQKAEFAAQRAARKSKAQERADKPKLQASMGMQYSSNLSGLPTANEDTPPIGVDDGDDVSLELKLSGRVPTAAKGDTFIFSIDSQLPQDLKTYGSTAVYVEYENSEARGKANLNRSLFFGTNFLDGQKSMHYFGLLVDYDVTLSESRRWKVNLTVKNESHDEPFFASEDRSGLNHTLSYTQYVKVGKSKRTKGGKDKRSDEIGFGINIKKANLDGQVYSMSGFGPRIEWTKPLCGGKSLSLRYLYYANRFDGPPVTNPNGPNRDDWRNQVDMNFTAPLENNRTFWTRFGFSRNRSNDFFQDRKSATIAAGVSYSF